jgi:hypothetical protein
MFFSKAHQLDLAARQATYDDPDLSVQQRMRVAQVREQLAALEGGLAAHAFRIVFVEEGAWHVDCEACGTRTSAQAGWNFLNNFSSRHVNGLQHQTAASTRLAALAQAVYDAAAEGLAAARGAAGAASQLGSMSINLGLAERLVDEARAALKRTELAAEAAAALQRGEAVPGAEARGRLEPQLLTSTPLERLVGMTPALEWLEDDAGARVGVSCAWCKQTFGGTDAQLKHNTEVHLRSAHHRERSSYGGRTILDFFGGSTRRGPAPPPHAPPDRSTLCHGFYKESVTYGEHTVNVRSLLECEPAEGAS